MFKTPIIIYPDGSILPENHQLNVVANEPLLQKLMDAREVAVPAMPVTTRQLEALTQYPDVFGVELLVLLGLHGGQYSAVWDSAAFGLPRISPAILDNISAALRADPNQGPVTSEKFAKLFDQFKQQAGLTDDSALDQEMDESDDTGDL